ncbi:unnamed protein product, partial [Mesorhabditis spiculigera]
MRRLLETMCRIQIKPSQVEKCWPSCFTNESRSTFTTDSRRNSCPIAKPSRGCWPPHNILTLWCLNYPPTKNFTAALRDGLPTINRRISENLLTRSVQRSGLYAYILDKMDTFFTRAFALSDPMSLSFACHHYSPLQMFEVYNSLLNCAPMSWPRVNLTNALMDTFRLIEQSPGWGKLGAEEADDYEHYKSNYIYLAQSSKTFEDYRANPAAFDAEMKQATDFLTTMIGLDRYTVLRRLAYWSQESNEKCMVDMLKPEYAMRHEYIMEIGQIMVKDLEKIAFLSDICSRVLANEPDYATAYKDQDLLATAQKLSHLLVSKQLYTTYPASDVPRCTPVGEHFPGGRP